MNWAEINPDIFGSMFQGIVEENHRETHGMHYTSVTNILKTLDPLFLDETSNSLILGSRNFLEKYDTIITNRTLSKEFIEEYYNMFYLMSSMFFSYLSKELILIYEVFPEGIPEIDIKDSYLTDTNFTDERMESYKIKNTLKRSLFNFSVDESTDYFQKYLKYKSKYLNLKTKINLSS